MEQSSKQSSNASFDNNQPGTNYSDEMLTLMRSIHSMMCEEREALQPSSKPTHPASVFVASQLTSINQVDPLLVAHIPSKNLSVEPLDVIEDHLIPASAPTGHGSNSPDLSTISHPESAPREPLVGNRDSQNTIIPSLPNIQIAPETEPTPTQQAEAHPALAPDPPDNALPTQASNPPEKRTEQGTRQGTKNGPFKVRRFGLKKDQATRDPLAANYDYTVKYPEDERYHELDPEARVWRVYGDEASAFDNDMVGELGDSLDILLVFAGLFSAVLTTFVAQTSQSLSQDYTQLSASYLSELTMLVRANGNNTAILNIPLTSTAFSPGILDLWVNGLWFTSLVISLSVALFAVLAKQWLRQYLSFTTGTPHEQAYIRQFRFDGLEKWRVQPLIGILPTFLHLALILFLAGLTIFLIPLSTTMAYIVGAISVTVVVLYLTATVLPLFAIQCSYRTTLTHLLYSRALYGLFRVIYALIISAYNWVWNKVRKRPADPEILYYWWLDPDIGNTLKEGERFIASHHQNQRIASLAWLHHYTSNPSAKSILFLSLRALPSRMSKKVIEITNSPSAFSQICEHLHTSTNLDELEGWFRAGIHYINIDRQFDFDLSRQEFKRRGIDSYISDLMSDHNCNINSALAALAFGQYPVKFIHAGEPIMLTPETVIGWIFDTYEEGLPGIPWLVWEPLLRRSSYDIKVLRVLSQYMFNPKPETRDLVISEHARLTELRSLTPLPNS